jgi:hypothetical protein
VLECRECLLAQPAFGAADSRMGERVLPARGLSGYT